MQSLGYEGEAPDIDSAPGSSKGRPADPNAADGDTLIFPDGSSLPADGSPPPSEDQSDTLPKFDTLSNWKHGPLDESSVRDAYGLSKDENVQEILTRHQNEQIDSFVEDVGVGAATAQSKVVYSAIGGDQVDEVRDALAPYLMDGHHLDQSVRIIEGGVVTKVLRDHGEDEIPIQDTDIKHAKQVLESGELVEVSQHEKGEVMILRRKLIEGNWLYAGETLVGSARNQVKRPTFRLKTLYWNRGPR